MLVKTEIPLYLPIKYEFSISYAGDESILEMTETYEEDVPEEILDRTVLMFNILGCKVTKEGKVLKATLTGTEYSLTNAVIAEMNMQIQYLTPELPIYMAKPSPMVQDMSKVFGYPNIKE